MFCGGLAWVSEISFGRRLIGNFGNQLNLPPEQEEKTKTTTTNNNNNTNQKKMRCTLCKVPFAKDDNGKPAKHHTIRGIPVEDQKTLATLWGIELNNSSQVFFFF